VPEALGVLKTMGRGSEDHLRGLDAEKKDRHMQHERLYRFRTESVSQDRSGDFTWTVEFTKIAGEGPNKIVRQMTTEQHARVAQRLLNTKKTWTVEEVEALPGVPHREP
jgi:hypothetical protein